MNVTNPVTTLTVYKDIGGAASTGTVKISRNQDGAVEFVDANGVTRFVQDEAADWIFDLINSISS